MDNIFAQFQVETKQVQIESLGNATITLRQPTIEKANEFSRNIFKGKDENGDAKLDYEQVFLANLTKVSFCMTDPIMSVDDLRGLSNSADKAIAEIIKNIDHWNGEEEVDEEGNSL